MTLDESPARRRAPAFAHASEAEMARILDFYEVRWQYEPHVFPLLWNLDGDVVESFAPDFWLIDLDLYLELTTLKQRLVRKKNRKLRRLRELYPDVRIKLFYGRDFRALMLKYGKLGGLAELSGTAGQLGVSGSPLELAARPSALTVAPGAAAPQDATGDAGSPAALEPAIGPIVTDRALPGMGVEDATAGMPTASARRRARRRLQRLRHAAPAPGSPGRPGPGA